MTLWLQGHIWVHGERERQLAVQGVMHSRSNERRNAMPFNFREAEGKRECVRRSFGQSEHNAEVSGLRSDYVKIDIGCEIYPVLSHSC